MSNETGKSVIRRGFDRRYVKWLAGSGIDIGSGDDPLGRYQELFPLMTGCRTWDLPDGDATHMAGIPDDTFDFVHSSHCLEHLDWPMDALDNWIRICKPGGHLLVMVPDANLYEQGVWPSTWAGSGHKWAFSIGKEVSWCPRALSVMTLLQNRSAPIDILKIELLDAGFLYNAPRFDQTRTMTGECAIEIVLKKRGT